MQAPALPLSRPGSTAVPLHLPLSFLLSGTVASVLLGIGAILVLPAALTDPQEVQVLALVHTATLGWFTMTIMGAMYQLVPVVLVTRLRAVPLAYCQMALYLAGVALLVSGFWFITNSRPNALARLPGTPSRSVMTNGASRCSGSHLARRWARLACPNVCHPSARRRRCASSPAGDLR